MLCVNRKLQNKFWNSTQLFLHLLCNNARYLTLSLLQKTLDYLKFDVEGYEWGVLQDLSKFTSLRENIKQVGFEIHTKHLMACRTTPGFEVTDKTMVLL